MLKLDAKKVEACITGLFAKRNSRSHGSRLLEHHPKSRGSEEQTSSWSSSATLPFRRSLSALGVFLQTAASRVTTAIKRLRQSVGCGRTASKQSMMNHASFRSKVSADGTNWYSDYRLARLIAHCACFANPRSRSIVDFWVGIHGCCRF